MIFAFPHGRTEPVITAGIGLDFGFQVNFYLSSEKQEMMNQKGGE